MKKLTITFPDRTAKRVERLPNPEEQQPRPAKSKWARLVEEIEENPLSLGDYAKQDQRDRAEFRRSFRFKHDKP